MPNSHLSPGVIAALEAIFSDPTALKSGKVRGYASRYRAGELNWNAIKGLLEEYGYVVRMELVDELEPFVEKCEEE